MEYNKIIDLARQSAPDAPDNDEVLHGVHRTLQRRRRQRTMAISIACIVLAITPLALNTQHSSPNTTLVETVSATLPSAPDGMPAPLQGYRNSLRNHQTLTVI